MGLDMYLEAEIHRTDPDPRAQAVFAEIDKHYPSGVPAGDDEDGSVSLYDPRYRPEETEKDPRIASIRQTVAEQFPVADSDNHWIGASFAQNRVVLPLMYWRKANAIHGWFVAKVQDGIDECQRAEVTREKLFELRKTIKCVEEHKDEAALKLPPVEGFFFGSYDIDDYYWSDIARTREMLDRIAEKGLTEQATIYYQSSW